MSVLKISLRQQTTDSFCTLFFSLVLSASLVVGCGKSNLEEIEDNSQNTNESAPLSSDLLIKQKALYRADDRTNYFENENEDLKRWSKSSVALVNFYHLDPLNERFSRLSGNTLGEQISLCKDARFQEERTYASCTGVLVDTDKVLTASHCVAKADSCEDTRFIFDLKKTHPLANLNYIENSKIYKCSKILYQTRSSQGSDFALIQLDRNVPDRLPLELRSEGALKPGDVVSMAGYPSGMALKLTENGIVRFVNRYFFNVDLDAMSGNSGAPVFSKEGMVEGILSRGEPDYEMVWKEKENRYCFAEIQCKDREKPCRGEDVTSAVEISKVLNEILRNSK